MAQTIRLTATDGTPVEFVDEVIGSGAMKDVYFSPDKSYVVGFFRTPQDANAKDRLNNITGVYRERIFNQVGGDYWKKLFCWPTKMVEWNGKLGIVCPTYDKHFFFDSGRFKGKEKEGKWFASAKLRNKFIEDDQKGTWLTHFHMCIQIARAVKRLHAAGLAHSDLSYKNVLVDPKTGKANIIDCDGLVVPGKYPPDVVGTPDFIAPEVLETRSLKVGDPNKKLPSIQTDRHALSVLIYMYLLYRHPLRGGKVNDLDAAKDEELSMGSKALFIEHPTDKSNRPKVDQLAPSELPQGDVTKLPYTICGPYLKELFDKALIVEKKMFFEKRIRRAFSRFVPEQIIDELVDELGKLGYGRERLENEVRKAGFEKGTSARSKKYKILEKRKYLVDSSFPQITDNSFKGDKLPNNIIRIEYVVNLDGIDYESW